MAEHKIKKITYDDEVGQIIHKDFLNEICEDFILIGDEETCMPKYYENFAESIRNFEVRDSDVFVCTYPKVGTTWTQEMVWLIGNDLDYENAKIDIAERFPFLEWCTLFNFDNLNKACGVKSPEFASNSVEFAKNQKDPRFIKTHLPFFLLPEQIQNRTKSPKIICVVRNPKDVCVSYYHHSKLIQSWRANLEDFSKVFMTNKMMFGSYWKFVLGYWEQRDLPNLLTITYEDMKRDLPSVLEKIANFLGKKLVDEDIEQLCKHLSFKSMKKNEAVNFEGFLNLKRKNNLLVEDEHFIRSGTVGKYKEEMSPETIQKIDVWTNENVAGTSFEKEYGYIL